MRIYYTNYSATLCTSFAINQIESLHLCPVIFIPHYHASPPCMKLNTRPIQFFRRVHVKCEGMTHDTKVNFSLFRV